MVVDKVTEHPAITVLPNATPTAFTGDGRLSGIALRDAGTGAERTLATDGSSCSSG